MIRKARPDDLSRVIKLGIEALNRPTYRSLLLSKERIEITARECISAPRHFAWVCEQDGIVMGALGAQTHDNAFFERQQATVMMWYCPVPGEGVQLMREFLRWARGRPVIKIISVSLEPDTDPRVIIMLRRLGLSASVPSLAEFR